MPKLFGKSEETAESVKKHYNGRIDRFLSQFESWNPLRRRQSPLDDLFAFARGIWEEKEKLRTQTSDQKEGLRTAEREIQRLQDELGSTLQRLSLKEQECENKEREIASLTGQYWQALNREKAKHRAELSDMKEKHAEEVRRLKADLLVNQED